MNLVILGFGALLAAVVLIAGERAAVFWELRLVVGALAGLGAWQGLQWLKDKAGW
jgi:hypothetical protein